MYILLISLFFTAILSTNAQGMLSGKVTDESSGSALPGVTVRIPGTITLGRERGYYITADSTSEGNVFGYVFLYSNITGNAPKHSFYLGRNIGDFMLKVFKYSII